MGAHEAYGYAPESNRRYTLQQAAGMDNRSEAYSHDRRNRLESMNRGTLTLQEGGGATVEAGDFLAHDTLKQKEDWVNLDRRGNWLEYGDSIDGAERIEKRFVNTANGYIDIAPDTHEEPTPCPTPQACPSPKYDFNGNMTFDPLGRVAGFTPSVPNVPASAAMGPGQEFVYDFENRVTSIHHDWIDGQTSPNAVTNTEPKVLEFVYDALGRRVETKEYIDVALRQAMTLPKITRHVYVGLENIQDWTCGEANPTCEGTTEFYVARQYLWGDPERYPEPVAMTTPFENQTPPGEPIVLEEAWHYLNDVLGSVIGLVDATGKLVERYTYDPYGKVYVETWNPAANENQGAWEPTYEPLSGLPYSAYGNPWMWTGYRYDAAVGLYHAPERTYSPTLGRWLQRDPIEYAAGSMNLYEYVLSNPLYWIDPLGLDQMPPGDSTSVDPDPIPIPGPVWNPGGHHWVPKSVARDHADELSDEAADVFGRGTSGPTEPSHNNRKMGDVGHDKYNDEVIKELEKFNKERGISKNRKMKKEEAEEFIKRLTDEKCPNEKIRKFNKAVREATEHAAKEKATKEAVKRVAKKVARKTGKTVVGKAIPFIGVGFFVYDWYSGGLGYAVNEATWPVSEAWSD